MSTKPASSVLANGISRHAFEAPPRPAPQRFVSEPAPLASTDDSVLRVRLAVYEAALQRIVEGCPVAGCSSEIVETYLVHIARAALEVG